MGEMIDRLGDWLSANRPEYFAQLQPGVSDTDLDDFERRFSLKLPSTFRSLYRWRNGQPSACFESLEGNHMFSSLADVADTKEVLDGMIGHDFEDPEWWRKEWVPFLKNGGGDHLCLDLSVGDGASGKLIAFWHDWEDRSVEFGSVDEWLRHVVDTMESGNVELL